MRSAPLRLLALIAASSLAVGCTSGSSDGGGDPPAATASTTTTAPTPPGPDLTAAGAGPRTALRLRLTEGTTTRVSYTTDLSVTQATASSTSQLDPPPVAQTIEYRVGPVDETGADVTFTVVDVVVAAEGSATTPEAALLLRAELEDLIGIAGAGHLSDRGHLDRVAFQLPSGLGATVRTQVEALEEQLGGLVPTLPVEAVGVGATWEATDTTTIGGVATRQTTTYALTAVDGDRLTFTSATSYATEPQDVAAAGLPAGTTARLVSSDLAGTASGTMDLTGPGHTLDATTTGTQVLDLAAGSSPVVRLAQRIDLATQVQAVA